MPRPTPEFSVILSVLDRLIDHEPRISSEPQLTRAQSVRQLKEAVRRDLEWLLNTRRIALPPDDGISLERNRSVGTFRSARFTGYRASNPAERNRSYAGCEAAVKLFEPRLPDIKVLPIDSARIVRANCACASKPSS